LLERSFLLPSGSTPIEIWHCFDILYQIDPLCFFATDLLSVLYRCCFEANCYVGLN